MSLKSTPTVIVGGGAAGQFLALELTLRGWNRVTLVERQEDPCFQDPCRAFSYAVSPRGHAALSRFPVLSKQIHEQGISTQTMFTITMDPNKRPHVKKSRFSSSDFPMDLLRRSTFMNLLSETLNGRNNENIRIIRDAECIDLSLIDRHEPGMPAWRTTIRHKNGKTETLPSSLVFACDGLNSAVRSACYCLHGSIENLPHESFASPNGFDQSTWTSPAVGLMYKTLVLPSYPNLVVTENAQHMMGGVEEELLRKPSASLLYVLFGKSGSRPKSRVFNVFLLPVGRDVSEGRTATIVLMKDHEIWKLESAEKGYCFFEENFPYLRIRDLICHDEMHRFVSTEPVLLGDAAHAFPPDLAVGLNAALEDVSLFCECLDEVEGQDQSQEPISKILELYNFKRDEDVTSLMRLVRIGFPYQYGQNRIAALLSMVNIVARARLCRIAPSLFSHSAFICAKSTMSFSEISRKVDETTLRIWLIFLSLAVIPVIAFLVF